MGKEKFIGHIPLRDDRIRELLIQGMLIMKNKQENPIRRAETFTVSSSL